MIARTLSDARKRWNLVGARELAGGLSRLEEISRNVTQRGIWRKTGSITIFSRSVESKKQMVALDCQSASSLNL
jgi:hypothetical protein